MRIVSASRWGSTLLPILIATACADAPPTAQDAPEPVPAAAARNPRNVAPSASRRAADGLSLDVSSSSTSGAIIGNAVVQLGIHPEGQLNVPGGQLSAGGDPTTYVGLRFVQTQSEATAPGCLCEGWGAADAGEGVAGYANEDRGGAVNLEVESFTVTTSTAVSRVLIRHPTTNRPWMRVTHDYHPSASTQYLYEATVTVENVSGQTIEDLRYRRVMDWDIAPNTFSEYSTIQGAGAANVLYASDNGFASADPLSARGSTCGNVGDFVDRGPCDHGALFDFGFGALPQGESKVFNIYYGAAPSEPEADFALSQVGAEVYSYGQASIGYTAGPGSACLPWTPAPWNNAGTGRCGAERGEPHTFIFAFASVGGAPVFEPYGVTLNISPRPISRTKSSLVTVWLPSTAEFDATRTVAGSATLGDESAPDAAVMTMRGAPYAMTGDFNRDGRMDMAFVFQRSDLQAAGDLGAGTTSLVLRASHLDKGLIRASGPVVVAP